MLIKALCDYYDDLAKANKVLPTGYSQIEVHYKICLSEDGKLANIINCQKTEYFTDKKGKTKQRQVPIKVMLPQRVDFSGVKANIIEHRPLYIFGLNCDKKNSVFLADDRTNKAENSHNAFCETNLEFLDGIVSPLINAYRKFIETWNPKEETENQYLQKIVKDYDKSRFVFCLDGSPDIMLQDEKLINDKWNKLFAETSVEGNNKSGNIHQCAIIGKELPIARLHNKIKGVYGGISTGSAFICYNDKAFESYRKEQSYNSNISQEAMKKYTEALNYLLSSSSHHATLDDITVVFWSINNKNDDVACKSLSALLYVNNDDALKEQTDNILINLIKHSQAGTVDWEELNLAESIDPNITFYIVGLTPYSSRIALRFIYKTKFGEILQNIATHQSDIQIDEDITPIALWQISRELISPNSKTKNINSTFATKLFQSMLYGTNYPSELLATVIRRVKTDRDDNESKKKFKSVNRVRVGLIKACINIRLRLSNQEEEIKMALDLENRNQAYLCGRLFAVLEKLQQEASNNTLNRTIKDAYFASAVSTPAVVFPKIIVLSKNHLNKLEEEGFKIYYNKLIGEIIDKLNSEFPDTLSLTEQGKFIIGYYQQWQNFFMKKNEEE